MKKMKKSEFKNLTLIRAYLMERNVSKRRKLTDRQLLAKQCNVSVSHVSNMLWGNRSASEKFIEKASELAERNYKKLMNN